jgi:hypothetical protein
MLRLALSIAALAILAAPAAAQQSFAFGHIDREGKETKEGPHAPPWTRTKVHASFFGVPAKRVLSGPVTILPHDPALPAAALSIQKFGPYEKEECTGQFSKYRTAELPELPGDAYRNYVSNDKARRGAAWVSEALIVHPAQPNAKTLPKQSVAVADMPKGFPLATLVAAFDLSGSGKAEVVKVNYCCYNAAFDDAQCIKAGGKQGGAQCTALFHKNKAGWRRVFMDHVTDC